MDSKQDILGHDKEFRPMSKDYDPLARRFGHCKTLGYIAMHYDPYKTLCPFNKTIHEDCWRR